MPDNSALFLSEKVKLERYCAYEDRCRFQISKKLNASLLSEEEKSLIIDGLLKDKFLDEYRFASAYVSGKSRIKKWGIYKIRKGLSSYQIDPLIIEKSLKELSSTEYLKSLKDLIEKKMVLLHSVKNPFEKKVKIIRFLTSKGYSLSEIYQAGIEED
ncbi:MAG: RecX family transcriptional regulator [Flavobacteriia bacterium]|nr:RecX family transcriptional regulator [Flavobacteriia bacterium]